MSTAPKYFITKCIAQMGKGILCCESSCLESTNVFGPLARNEKIIAWRFGPFLLFSLFWVIFCPDFPPRGKIHHWQFLCIAGREAQNRLSPQAGTLGILHQMQYVCYANWYCVGCPRHSSTHKVTHFFQ